MREWSLYFPCPVQKIVTFGPLTRPPRKRRFDVYDLEWVPGDVEEARARGMVPLELRVIGHFDGRTYRHYQKVPDFLNAVCTRENDGKWFFAHAGGLADLVFVLQYLVDHPRPGVKIRCTFSGSSAIIVTIERGDCKWFFCDSYWLIRQPLREIGEWLGMSKGGSAESTEHFYAPLGELITYNERDCRVLYKALVVFEREINRLGGELQKTIASTALDLFRRRFLHEKIRTTDEVNGFARQAYYASRVEPFCKRCEHADYYDVNSSFPYAMTFDAPGNLSRWGKRLRDDDLGLVEATIKVPELDIPPAPYRGDDGRLYFPTGRWRAWFTSEDFRHLQGFGASVERVHQVLTFEPFGALRGYAETIYGWRKSTKDPALKIILKFLLNSLYGKFGEQERKQRVVIHPSSDFFDTPEREPGGLGREMLMPGVHAIVEDRSIPHAHVPIAAHITAVARRVLDEYLVQAPRVYYCDTDGFAVPESSRFELSDELGGLKLEKHVFEGVFAAPKLYAFTEDGSSWTVKGKGFSRVSSVEDGKRKSHRLRYDDFCKLLGQKELELEQFGRLRALWRDGETAPRERIVTKKWRNTMRQKRCPVGDYSRPWNVKEISA